MRVMVDTNVLLSALVFRSIKMARLLEEIGENYTMVICTYVIDEFRKIVSKKALKYNFAVDSLFSSLPFELVFTPRWHDGMPCVRDEKDKPVIAAAIMADVDIVVTGDKDFHVLEIERPEIISPSDFWTVYIKK